MEYYAVLATQKETIGPRHPDTLTTQHALAVLIVFEGSHPRQDVVRVDRTPSEAANSSWYFVELDDGVGEACALMQEVVDARTAAFFIRRDVLA